MPGYFDKKEHAANQKLYPNLAKLDAKVAKMLASPQAKLWPVARKEYEICRIHPVYWMEEYGHIKQATVDGSAGEVEVVPFKLNPVQLQTANQICKSFIPDQWLRVQVLVLKHRKAGVSTLCAGFDYWLMRFIKRFNYFAIADLASHTDNLVEMVRVFHEHDTCGNGCEEPRFHVPGKVPMSKNKKGYRLANESMLEQDSGENSNPGTSGTIQGCHMSENSKWRDPESAEASLLNSIPRVGFAFIVKESTAYGINKFAKDCEEALKGRSNWDLVFISWKDLPDCEYELVPGEVIEYTDQERDLVAQYHLRPGHIKFKRSQISLLGSEMAFQQDYPLNAREPFLITGKSYFPLDKVQERISEIQFFRDWKCRDEDYMKQHYPEWVSRIKYNARGEREALALIEDRNVIPRLHSLHEHDDIVTIVMDENAKERDGALTVFRLPQRTQRYLVIVDVAEGLSTTEYTSDNSIIEVMDTYRREQVAEWGGIFDEEVTAHYAVLIARAYENCDIVVEMNNKCGGILWEKLRNSGYRHLYCRQTVVANQIKEEPGWKTTAATKPEVCGQLRLDFKNGDVLIHSIPLLEEMLFFVDMKGKLGASSGHTDDRVMALSVGDKVIASTPAYRQPDFGKRKTSHELPRVLSMARHYDAPRNVQALRRYR
jgi:hypothetical protein